MSGPPQILADTLGTPSEDVEPGKDPLPDLVPSDSTRPYVTLTFAQSIDAKIAGAGGKQLILSGEESMKMTHWWVITAEMFETRPSTDASQDRMRTMHDGILIGIGTVVNDNPQLNGAYPIMITVCCYNYWLIIHFGSPSSPISGAKHAFPALPPPTAAYSWPTPTTFIHV
jgi:hypothetical protein